MLKKLIIILRNIIVAVFGLYFLMTLVLIPFLAPMIIKSQAGKILKHKVNVRSVTINPFLLRVNLNGFDILDSTGQSLVGFKHFSTDVSFVGLLKKKYQVESVLLDGLNVHVVLAEGNKINLLDLVPQNESVKTEESVEENEVAQENTSAQQPLPAVFVDKISLTNGQIQFTDQAIAPGFSTSLSEINFSMSGFSTEPDALTKISFNAKLGDKGLMSAEADVKPLKTPLEMEMTYSLNSYALEVLTPYVGKYTGRAVKDGKFDLKMDYRISDNKLTATHKILIQHFDFGDKVESKDALKLPFGLAVALLEDPSGKISIVLPVTGNLNDPEFEYFHLIGQVASNFFIKLLTKPFAFLASALGAESGTDEMGYTRFLPGKSELTDEDKQKLSALINGLKDRPKLSLEINGSYDPSVDWKAIKEDVLKNDYDTLKKEAMEDSKIYQMLYQRRFGIMDLWALTKKYKLKVGDYDHEKLIAEIKQRLIEDGSADTLALEILAGKRAQAVYDYIVQTGFDQRRVSIGPVKKVQSTMGQVSLEFTLTIFESPAE